MLKMGRGNVVKRFEQDQLEAEIVFEVLNSEETIAKTLARLAHNPRFATTCKEGRKNENWTV